MPATPGPADVVTVNKQDHEAAENEEQVDSRMAELRELHQQRRAEVTIDVPRRVIQHDGGRGDATQRLQPGKPRRAPGYARLGRLRALVHTP